MNKAQFAMETYKNRRKIEEKPTQLNKKNIEENIEQNEINKKRDKRKVKEKRMKHLTEEKKNLLKKRYR